MIRTTLPLTKPWCIILLLLITSMNVVGQRKSDLIKRIDSLESQVRGLQNSLAQSQASEKASLTNAESYKKQVNELKEANNTLLENLGNFADVSNKNSAALNQALGSLNAREQQLKGIVDNISSNDSTIIALLTDAKGTLGAKTQLKVSAGSLVISGGLTELFGSDTGTELTEEGKAWLNRVANLLKAYPDFGISVDGLSMTGDLNLAALQATSVMNALRTDFSIPETRMSARARDGNFSEGVDILLHPDYRKFYQYVKTEFKN